MSKNVAVFVDVANIFYAAKAGGVDIDYVTLLKSAVAGRDFVRAYAYTGLDPENENQRQFHSFLARSGYKVVSKDIRKYGDGRIKANLDIELVVDLMRLARNLDIAVVVSGDGDFAPAIRAVQEMGVRVEVISFRGNTSSDLIEVADQFTDIAQVARVEKGSARSGRRVAAEGDLSMTAVPEKETEGAPRRRRGRLAAERTPEVAETGTAGNLIVLPGERLSRAPEDEVDDENGATVDEGDEAAQGEAAERRRRRRRGGRGRGRGRRDEMPVGESAVAAEGNLDEEEDDFEEVPAQLPHHTTFGSVWDSQLGVPSAVPVQGSYEPGEEEEDYEEPEVPEYLLAERRQRQRGGRGRMQRGGRQGAYQAALERERYGRTGGSFGGSRLLDRPPRQDRRRGGPPAGAGQRPPRQDRDRPAPERRPAEARASAPSGDPWTEVPEDLEELLRAELTRKLTNGSADGRPPSGQPAPAPEAAADEPAPAAEAAPDGEEKPKRATRSRAKPTDEAAEAAPDGEEKPKRATRSRAKPTDEAAEAAPDGEEKPKRATRSRAKPKDDAAEPAPDGEEKPKRATRSRAKPKDDAAEG